MSEQEPIEEAAAEDTRAGPRAHGRVGGAGAEPASEDP